MIEVAGEDEPRQQSIRWTIWGPVMDPDHKGRLRALRWVAHDPARLAASITALEAAQSIEEAFDAEVVRSMENWARKNGHWLIISEETLHVDNPLQWAWDANGSFIEEAV